MGVFLICHSGEVVATETGQGWKRSPPACEVCSDSWASSVNAISQGDNGLAVAMVLGGHVPPVTTTEVMSLMTFPSRW